MMKQFTQIVLLRFTVGLTLLNSGTVGAQIVPDQTLPNNSIVTPNGNIIQINGGTQAGNNLFHSFQEFSVPINNTAAFNNAVEIQNIFSRVTGNSSSNIDGIIKANGTANLFLINPNGIVFGPNAALKIGGSFIASTANRVIFSDGFEFSATNPQATPLLTVNVPIGLGFGSSPGQITNQSRATKDTVLIGRFGQEDQFISGLQVNNGKTLALVGGDVNLTRGYLTANEGRIELGSVAGNNTVSLTPIKQGWQLGYEGIQAFQDISLSSRAKVDTSGRTGGDVQLQSRQLQILDGSSILTKTFGTDRSGKLTINATESVLVSGSGSLLSTDAFGGSSGNAGELNIISELLTIERGGKISSNTVGTGDGGAIALNVDQLIIRDKAIVQANSDFTGKGGTIIINAANSVELQDEGFILSFARNNGDGGDIIINTNYLNINDESILSASTNNGRGKAGDISVTASDVSIGKESRISVQTTRAGDGGNIVLNTENLTMLDGGRILADTTNTSTGRGGTITINATGTVKAIGSFTLNETTILSGIFTETKGTGDAGDIVLNTDGQLIVEKGAAISANTFSTGNAGQINLNVGQLLVRDGGMISSGSLFGEDTSSMNTGAGGTIIINATESVTATGSFTPNEMADPILSSIFTETKGTGNAGNIFINSNILNVTDEAQITASTSGLGAAGNIFVGASTFSVSNRGKLLTTTAGIQNAGNISIQSNNLILNGQGGGIFADTEVSSSGNGGSIFLNSQNTNINDGATISVNSLGTGIGGDITLQGNKLTLNNQASLSATTASTDGGNIDITLNDRLLLRNQSNISATAALTGGAGDGGNITIDSTFIVAVLDENSDITANAFEGNGGNINITTQGIFGIQPQPEQTPRSDITASSETGIQGNVNIINPNANLVNNLVEFPENPVDVATLVAQNVCPVEGRRASSFVIKGRGGLPPIQAIP